MSAAVYLPVNGYIIFNTNNTTRIIDDVGGKKMRQLGYMCTRLSNMDRVSVLTYNNIFSRTIFKKITTSALPFQSFCFAFSLNLFFFLFYFMIIGLVSYFSFLPFFSTSNMKYKSSHIDKMCHVKQTKVISETQTRL